MRVCYIIHKTQLGGQLHCIRVGKQKFTRSPRRSTCIGRPQFELEGIREVSGFCIVLGQEHLSSPSRLKDATQPHPW
eukprot:3905114-Amphidinium_carterae.1